MFLCVLTFELSGCNELDVERRSEIPQKRDVYHIWTVSKRFLIVDEVSRRKRQKRERGRGAICHPTDLPNFATIVVTTMSARVRKDTRAFTIQEKILRAAHMRKLVRPLRSHHP